MKNRVRNFIKITSPEKEPLRKYYNFPEFNRGSRFRCLKIIFIMKFFNIPNHANARRDNKVALQFLLPSHFLPACGIAGVRIFNAD